MRGVEDTGDWELNDEGNETRNVGRGWGKDHTQKRKRDREDQSQTCGTPYLVLTPCAPSHGRNGSKRRGHMARAIAMAFQLQSGGEEAAGRSIAVLEL